MYYAVVNVLLLCKNFLNGALYGKAIHKASELLGSEFPGFIRSARPLEPVAGKKPFGQKEHSVSFKQKSFYAVRPVAAKEEQRSLFCCAQTVVQLNIRSKAGDPFSEVNAAAAYDHAGKPDSFLKHG